MNEKILVTYASRTGATCSVAEAIGKTLAESGASVEVLPMGQVHDLVPYRAVVAGSAIRGAAWLPEAVQFVHNNQTELARKPFAIFAVCMTLAMPKGEQYRENVSTWLNPVRTLVHPVSVGLFAGTLDLKKVPASERLKFRLSVLMGVWKTGDHRNWQAIRAWAESLLPLLNLRTTGSMIGEHNGRRITALL